MKPLPILFLLGTLGFSATTSINLPDAYARSYKAEKATDYKTAIGAMTEVLKAYPNGYTVNLRLGWLNYLGKNYEAALEKYGAALKIVPTSVEARLGLANTHYTLKQFAEAEKILLQIMASDPMNYAANLRLSWIGQLTQRPELSEKIALKMLALFPSDVAFLTEYGWARWAQGDFDGAAAIFTDILILDPQNLDAKAFQSTASTPKKKK